ncbi:MAG: hypothetical protein U0871_12690 [Gemmataceae bacterium]
MSRTLELPDALYAALERAAADRGLDPVGWLAAALPPAAPDQEKTLAERFAGRTGRITSGRSDLSADTGRQFAEGMEEKRREGRL